MPGLSVLPTAAKIGEGVNAAHLQPGNVGGREGRSHGDVESAVSVEQRRIVAIELDAFLRRDEHWDSRPVFARVEHLTRLVHARIE